MRILFITLYDNYCFGARSLVSYLNKLGHDVHLVVFKQFKVPFFPYTDRDSPNLAKRPDVLFVEREDIGGMYCCPFTDEVTDTEKNLLTDLIKIISPDIAAFSLTSVDPNLAAELTLGIRNKFPEMNILWGGIYPTLSPEECLKHADAVCIGEGEEALAEYLNNLGKTDIQNFWFKDKNGGVIKNPLRPLITDLDSLPFVSYGHNEYLIDYNSCVKKEASDIDYYKPYVIMMTQRGCPFSCTYCLHHKVRELYKGQKYIRRRSVDNVLIEIDERIKQYNLDHIYFWDEIFVKDAEWITEFASKFKGKFPASFGGYGYPKVSTGEMFRTLKDAGMIFTAFGVQSGSRRILDLYNRRYKLEDLKEVAYTAVQEGLEVCYDFLSNNPFENEDDLLESLKFILQLPKPGGYILFHLRIFNNLVLNTSGERKYNLSDDIFTFWNYLYFIALERLLPEEEIIKLTKNQEYKQNPNKLIELTLDLKRKRDGKIPLFDEPEKHFKPPVLNKEEASFKKKIKRKIKKILGI